MKIIGYFREIKTANKTVDKFKSGRKFIRYDFKL